MDLQSIKNRFGIIGNDPQLNYALQVAEQVANTDLSVLIFGESGVGKEVFSQIIHNLSSRRHNPFIAVNCGAIPEGTIDSELFGHEKGSFTSASDQRKGYFETVSGGTIFLDEIGEMPIGTQARLLRVLETGEFIRVGSSKVLKTNVRVIAATNKDLLTLTQQGKFREDLYYRLNTVPIRVPALRERKEDIPMLFRKFVGDFSEKYKSLPVQLDESARQLLMTYGWPGNVRELKNIAEQISVLAKDRTVNANQLSQFLPNKEMQNRMPAISHQNGMPVPSFASGSSSEQGSSTTEREILYKLFFDLKKDMNDLKKMMFELAHQGGNFTPATHNPYSAEPILSNFEPAAIPDNTFNTPSITNYQGAEKKSNPYVIHHSGNDLNHHEEVEESLSLIDREKEFIIKALQKHKGKRKDAAQELGISERTLYRKIKEYDIEE
ncbi:sigma-54-dependent Fis family transcriptional regulator [Taibaiella lutea]|uniref:Sigma-54-dependent Fis family transcriptional regulator n=1 Tax=Taibaiella lutea TaxID=2608001 RepID=A0A5M6CNK7_9BACT|nr:sigma-54 dependent transcriptional regulator [Taibaiella lutea]KAA5534865.1 sigma-54-dependent Fis family transcriptional regulator [Taibaiella lutea]